MPRDIASSPSVPSVPRWWSFAWAAAASCLAIQAVASLVYGVPIGYEAYLLGIVAAVPALLRGVQLMARRLRVAPRLSARYLPLASVVIAGGVFVAISLGAPSMESVLLGVGACSLLLGMHGSPAFLAGFCCLLAAGLAYVSGATALAQEQLTLVYWLLVIACVDEAAYQIFPSRHAATDV